MRYLSSVVPKGGTKEDALCVSGVIREVKEFKIGG